MSIERQHGQQCITCNDCEDSLEFFGPGEFDAMIADARERNWRIVNHDGTWHHHCGCTKRDRVGEARRMFGICA